MSRSTPTVSVITPAFNVAPFVGACIESVLQQSFGDFEMLVVDDGSSDGTGAVIAEYATLDTRVRPLGSPNRGVSHARNLAMCEARGRYFAFIDADDLWDPSFLAEQLAVLHERPQIAVVTGNGRNLGSSADGLPVRSWPETLREITLLDMIEHEDAVFIMSVFHRRVFETIGGLDERLHRSEDYEFWLRAAAVGYRFVANPQPLGGYRRRAGSASANEAGMLAGIIEVLGRIPDLCGSRAVAERAAARRQIQRFERQLLRARARTALVARDFPEAVRCLEALARLKPALSTRLVSLSARLIPRLLLRAYRLKLEWHERRADRLLRRRSRLHLMQG